MEQNISWQTHWESSEETAAAAAAANVWHTCCDQADVEIAENQ